MSNKKLHGNINKGIYFKTIEEAKQFIKSMSEISYTYGFIFCADVLDYFLEDCNVNHDRYGWFDTSHWFVHFVGTYTPYIDYSYRVQLSKPIHYSDGSRLETKETGPAWDGFRAGVEEAERDIHGGLTMTSITNEANKIKENYKEWIKKNPYTDFASLYPKSLFVLPLSQQKLKPKIKNVIFNEPATIVFWTDGTKTVVKTQEDEKFDPEKGLAMAISKKALGNNREYYHTFLHWLKDYDKKYYWKTETVHWSTHKKTSSLYKAYELLVDFSNHKDALDKPDYDEIIEHIIGYLGDALED